MIINRYKDVKYTINSTTIKVGDLTDNQLDCAYLILKNKHNKQPFQKIQFAAICFVRNKRSSDNFDSLMKNYGNRMIVKNAQKRADIIMNWLINIKAIPDLTVQVETVQATDN